LDVFFYFSRPGYECVRRTFEDERITLPRGLQMQVCLDAGGAMHKSTTVIAVALLFLTLSGCGTIGGVSRGVGEAASGVGEDFSSVGEWIGNF
jgi:predicted small secreted protein